MTRTARLLTALALGFGCGVGAAESPAAAQGDISATSVAQGPAKPAESGAKASAATLGPLAIGAEVRDSNGTEIGHLTLLTTDKDGRSVAKVRSGEDVYTIPVGDLYARQGGAISTLSLDELKHGGGAIAAGGAR
jgi:hypothetical protein